MEIDINANEFSDEAFWKTKQLVEGILVRLDLLLHVNISPADSGTLTRTVSQCIEAIKTGKTFWSYTICIGKLEACSGKKGFNPFPNDKF